MNNAASQIKIYQTPGSDRKNIFQRSDSDLKKKKIDLAHRGKSLKFWKAEKPEPKIITHLIGFFNTFSLKMMAAIVALIANANRFF